MTNFKWTVPMVALCALGSAAFASTELSSPYVAFEATSLDFRDADLRTNEADLFLSTRINRFSVDFSGRTLDYDGAYKANSLGFGAAFDISDVLTVDASRTRLVEGDDGLQDQHLTVNEVGVTLGAEKIYARASKGKLLYSNQESGEFTGLTLGYAPTEGIDFELTQYREDFDVFVFTAHADSGNFASDISILRFANWDGHFVDADVSYDFSDNFFAQAGVAAYFDSGSRKGHSLSLGAGYKFDNGLALSAHIANYDVYWTDENAVSLKLGYEFGTNSGRKRNDFFNRFVKRIFDQDFNAIVQ